MPLDLNTYKFMGGEPKYVGDAVDHAGYLLFSGPVQLDTLESQNTIAFAIDTNDTSVKIHIEHAELALSLAEVTKDGHTKTITGSGHSLARTLHKGVYKVAVTHANS